MGNCISEPLTASGGDNLIFTRNDYELVIRSVSVCVCGGGGVDVAEHGYHSRQGN